MITYFLNKRCLDKGPNLEAALKELDLRTVRNAYDLYDLFHMLADTKRRGFMHVDKYIVESNMEHMYKTAALCLFVAYKYDLDLDYHKMTTQAIFHDISEAYFGDIVPSDNVDFTFRKNLEESISNQILADEDIKALQALVKLHMKGNDDTDKFVRFIDKMEFFYEYKHATEQMVDEIGLSKSSKPIKNLTSVIGVIDKTYKDFKIKNKKGEMVNLYVELFLPAKEDAYNNALLKAE